MKVHLLDRREHIADPERGQTLGVAGTETELSCQAEENNEQLN